MKTRVTQSEIAHVAGVHNTTVSLALRNCPSIPEATRKRIHAIAEELGYSPDPVLQALIAYRNGRTPNRRHETLAYVTNWNSRWGWQNVPAHARYHVGAQRRAAQLGFQLEHFWFGEPGMSPRRFGNMLFHRGVSGVILASHRDDCDALLEMEWPRVTAVKIGCFPHAPALNRVSYDRSGAMRMAMRHIRAAGYTRIGVVMPRAWDDCADQAWSAGFLVEQARGPADERVPILWHGAGRFDGAGLEEAEGCPVPLPVLDTWLRRHQPEVVLGASGQVRGQLEALGLVVPRDIAYADLFLDGSETGVAGVRERCERVGEVATELLVTQMHQNLRGLPEGAMETLVEGSWTDGESLPVRGSEIRWTGPRASCTEKRLTRVA
ncbi:MAG TPA: LacI family DNA-binding transcriptional regulator [Opitutaceae bacterium]|nr:LacI family DNA-binding transcriptional regulator [Opitutaceae bacterium]